MGESYFIAKGKHLVVPVTKQEYEDYWNKKRKEPITNEEWLRSCSTEELAIEICSLVDEEILDEWHKNYPKIDNWNDNAVVLKWLKEKHI